MKRFTNPAVVSAAVGAACLLGVSASFAADFFTDFDAEPDVNPAGPFTVTDGTLRVTFEGGTVFTANVLSLYRSGSQAWMVDPDMVRGSNGTGRATLSEGATSLTLYGRTQSNAVIARVQVLDDGGSVINETNLNESDWTRIDVSRNSGDSLIETVIVENMSNGMTQNLMVAIEDFAYSTDPVGLGGGGGGSSGSSAGPLSVLALGLGCMLAAARRRR